MRRVLLALCALGCGGKSSLVVTLTSELRLAGITAIRVTIGTDNDSLTADYPAAGVTIAPDSTQSLVAVLPSSRKGENLVIASAFVGANDLAIGSASFDAQPGKELEVTLAMTTGFTGDPCRVNGECRSLNQNTPAICLVDGAAAQYPRGYCTAPCNPARSNPTTGVNPDCPGRGVCTPDGHCFAACTRGSCARAGYVCFSDGCGPKELSACNPTQRGQCGAGRTCFRTGPDDVGGCTAACNPFQQNCPPIGGDTAGCYVSFDTGEAGCLGTDGFADGQACRFLNSCSPGSMCTAANVCRPYCGGPGARACAGGRACVTFSNKVPVATAGVCGG